MDRGRPSVKNPIDLIRSVVRRSNRSISRSRSRSPPKPSNTYQIYHSHSTSNNVNHPPLYIQINIDNSGAIIRPSAETIPGVALCSCQHSTNVNLAKQIFFCCKPTSLESLTEEEHLVAGNFLIPYISSLQKSLHNARPLLFRLDTTFPNAQWGQPFEVSFEELKRSIFSSLQDIQQTLTEDEENEDIDHIYTTLFDALPSAPSPPPLYLQQPPPRTLPISNTLPLTAGVDDNINMNVNVHDGGHGHGHVDPHVDPLSLNSQGSHADDRSGRSSRQSQSQTSRSSSRRGSASSVLKNSDLGILIVRKNHLINWSIPITPHTPSSPTQVLTQLDELSNLTISAGGASYPILSLFYTYNVNQQAICLFASRHHMPLQIIFPYSVSPTDKTIFTSCPCPDPKKFEIPPKYIMEASGDIIGWYYNLQAAIIKDSFYLQSLASRPQPQSRDNDGSDSDNEEVVQGHVGGDQRVVNGLDQLNLSENHQPPAILRSSVPVYQPPILGQDKCPEAYTQFWKLQALPRASQGSSKRVSPRFVAPRYPRKMLEVAAHVNLPDLLSDEFLAYAKCYQAIVNERNYVAVQKEEIHIGILMDAAILASLGKGKILEDLKKSAPVLRDQKLSELTEASLQSFFFQARLYCLNSSIPYWSFPDFFLNPKTFGTDIYNKLTEILLGYPSFKSTLRQFSCFLESCIKQILPIQESYTNSEQRIIEEHRSFLLSDNPSADYTKISLQSDAQDLVIKSPYFKQNSTLINEESKRTMIEMEKSNLLFKIVSNTHYETELIQLLIANDKYPSLDQVPYSVLISNLENLILVGQKAEMIEVNMSKAKQPRSRTIRSSVVKSKAKASPRRDRSKTRSSSRGRTASTRSPQVPRRRSLRSSRSSSGSRQPPSVQEACDICLLFEIDTQWCRKQNHCRQPGHQPQTLRANQREKQIMSGDFSMFIKHQDCSKCKTVLLALTNPASIPPAFNVPPPQVFQNNYSSPPTILKRPQSPRQPPRKQ